MASKQPVAREQWGSRIGVILAVAGSAVGLGNFLRFPGQAAQNGGGAFMIPYFVSLLVLGIPICWAEWTMGRYGGIRGFNSAPGIFSVIWRNGFSKYLGVLAVVIPLVIYMYYVVIEAWCLGYAFYYLTGDLMLGSDPQKYSDFFNSYVGKNQDGFLYSPGEGQVVKFILFTFLLNFALIYRGVSKGIETFCKWAIPLMAMFALCVLIRVLTLPPQNGRSVLDGLGFMWNPNFSELGDPQTWLAASGQIFFSLSVGFGVVVNYSSYLKRKDDIALSGLTSTSMNEFFEVCLGGLITLPAAFIFLGAATGNFGTFDLGFNALPSVFAMMPFGRLFGFVWFFMLFLAAITSSLSMLQPVIAFLEEGFGLRRHASVAFLGLITALGSGYVIYFSKGLVALDTLDFWVGTLMIVSLGLIQSLLYGWGLGIQRGDLELHRGAHIRVPRIVQYMLKYVVPVYLLIILIGFCVTTLPSKDKPAFSADAALARELAATPAGAPAPDGVRKIFEAHDAPLPEKAIVEGGRSGEWRILDTNRILLFAVEASLQKAATTAEDAAPTGATLPGNVQVIKHTPGYLETIRNSPVALMSVLFIAVLIGFTLLMIHIAGKRWTAEGRYERLADEDGQLAAEGNR